MPPGARAASAMFWRRSRRDRLSRASARKLRQERDIHCVALEIVRVDEHRDALRRDEGFRIEPQVFALEQMHLVAGGIEPARDDPPGRTAVHRKAAIEL